MMDKLSAEDVLSRYADGERDFSWRDLSGLDLHNADLRDANFTGTVLFATNLNGANLERANLNQASLQNAWLRDSNLRWASLLDADLTGADLTGSDLTSAIVQLSRTSNQVTKVARKPLGFSQGMNGPLTALGGILPVYRGAPGNDGGTGTPPVNAWGQTGAC